MQMLQFYHLTKKQNKKKNPYILIILIKSNIRHYSVNYDIDFKYLKFHLHFKI